MHLWEHPAPGANGFPGIASREGDADRILEFGCCGPCNEFCRSVGIEDIDDLREDRRRALA